MTTKKKDWLETWWGQLLLLVVSGVVVAVIAKHFESHSSPVIKQSITTTVDQPKLELPAPVDPANEKKTIPTNKVVQHGGKSNGAIAGPVTVGACGVIQNGGTQNTANPNCAPPERHLTEAQAQALGITAASMPEPQTISIENCNTPECQRYAFEIYSAFKKTAPNRLRPNDPTTAFAYKVPPPPGITLCINAPDTVPYAQPMSNILGENNSAKLLKCQWVKDDEIHIIISTPE